MKIYGQFSDINDNIITVTILNTNVNAYDININTSSDVDFTGDPVEISTELDSTFDHIIPRTAKISLLSKIYLGDYLYAPRADSVVVNIKRGNECIFAGFVTPNSFNQDYADTWEPVTINCIDYLGTLEYRSLLDEDTYENLKANTDMRLFKWFLEKIGLNTTTTNISNYPNEQYAEVGAWVTAGYMKKDGKYYELEKQVNIINQNVAMDTGQYRLGNELTTTPVPSNETTVDANIKYQKNELYVTVNGVPYNTGDYEIGIAIPANELPQVTGTQERLSGYIKSSNTQFTYYEQFTLDFVMDDGTIKEGYLSRMGDTIPLYPSTTNNNSTYEFRQGSPFDLIRITHSEGDTDDELYYKDYAWVRVNDTWYNTGDYRQGDPYEDEMEPDDSDE